MNIVLPRRTDNTDSFFRAFLTDARAEAEDYAVVRFGDTPGAADEGLKLVLAGIRRAMAELPDAAASTDNRPADDRLAEVGDHAVAIDGSGKPRCVLRVTAITVAPFNTVDDDFATEHGDGEQSREDWLNIQRPLLTRQAERAGMPFSDETPTAFIRFTVVWPRLFADDWKGPRLQ